MSRKKKDVLAKKIIIKDLDSEGYGCAETASEDEKPQLLSIPWTLPGDHVSALMGRKKKGRRLSQLQEILCPSPLRITPRCAHFGTCGGCRWQHLPYSEQLKQKDKWIAEYFAPLLSDKSLPQRPIIPCELPWEYRNKMEFSFSQNRAGEQFLGLMRSQGRGRVEDLKECHLVKPWFMEALSATRKWWKASGLAAYFPPANVGSLRTLTLREGRRTGDRMVILLVSGNPDFALNRSHLESFTEAMSQALTPDEPGKLSVFVRIQQIQKGRPTQFYELHLLGPVTMRERLLLWGEGGMEFHISPTAFFQPNTVQAERLYREALDLAQLHEDMLVYDLYCGTGTLGILAAPLVQQVVGIEWVPEATLDAEENLKTNAIENMNVHTGDVGQVLEKLREDPLFQVPDLVMLDPPRVGLDQKALTHLVELSPKKILYISCNPRSQADNCSVLKQAGYEIQALQAVDQFPHTIHIENIALLQRI